MRPRLSIVIVSYNARHDLARCLDSLLRDAPSTAHEILVIDNASSDGSADLARQRPGVRVIEAGANVGFAKANNLGIRASQGDVVLLLNSDTIVPPSTVDRLVEELDGHPDVAVVGPRLVDGAGRAELSFGWMIGPVAEVRQKLLVRGSELNWPILQGMVERMTRRRRFPDWVSGACLLVRRADADAVGLLDERFFMYTEDVDFCAAIRARGRRVLFAPEIEVVHLRGRSAAAAPRATSAAYERSRLAFYDKHHPRWSPLLRAYLRLRGRLP
ncbi:MAG: glycosyltransferase family 2 protein [Betaproteobacteria bacterium]